MPRSGKASELLDALLKRDRRAAARLITMVENEEPETAAIMKRINRHTGRAYVIGVTGPLGVGKSTFIDAVVKEYRNRKKSIGIVAVDPSSRVSGGAFLGDRVRLMSNIGDQGVFFRSLSTRGCLGGLSRCTRNVLKILDVYGSDILVLETAGAGQADVEVQRLADTTVVILSPAIGDEIQLMKSGIVEIADVFIVNKADFPGTEIMTAMLNSCSPKGDWRRPVATTIANKNVGISDAVEAIEKHRSYVESLRTPKKTMRPSKKG